MSFVVTLIHGTWAPRAGWTKDDSALVVKIHRSVSESVQIERFHWTGWNRHSSRLRAAVALREHIRACAVSHPDSKQVIIAHSHGGSVALQALRDPEVCALIEGLACLSTPFINARRRNLGVVGLWPVLIFLGLAVIAAAKWAGLLIAPESDELFQFLAGFLVVLPLPLIGANYLRRWLTSLASRPETADYKPLLDKIEHTFDFPSMEGKDLLILRAGGDEASSFLAMSQLVSWAISRLYRWIGQASFWTVKTIALVSGALVMFAVRRAKWIAGIFFVLLLTLWILGLKFHLSGDLYLFLLLAPLALMLMTYAIFVLIASGLMLVGLIFFPIAVLMCLAVLPFGLESVLFSLLLEVTVEATPPGRWTLHQLGASAGNVPLWHSATYSEPAAIQIICRWLEAVGSRRPGLPR